MSREPTFADQAHASIAFAIDAEYGSHFRPLGMADHAIAAVPDPDDGRTIRQLLDEGIQAEAERDALRAEVEVRDRLIARYDRLNPNLGRGILVPPDEARVLDTVRAGGDEEVRHG